MDAEICTDKAPDIERLVELFREAGWDDKTDVARLRAMVSRSTVVATAWLEGRMVGFARCLSDGVFNGQINNVVVEKGFRGQGVGRRLVEALLGDSAAATYLLRADPENLGFYERLGFEPADRVLVRRRKGSGPATS